MNFPCSCRVGRQLTGKARRPAAVATAQQLCLQGRLLSHTRTGMLFNIDTSYRQACVCNNRICNNLFNTAGMFICIQQLFSGQKGSSRALQDAPWLCLAAAAAVVCNAADHEICFMRALLW